MAEKQLDQMNNRIDASRQYITRLRDTLTTVKVAEQKVKTQLDSTMEQKQQLEQKLEEIEQEQKPLGMGPARRSHGIAQFFHY